MQYLKLLEEKVVDKFEEEAKVSYYKFKLFSFIIVQKRN